MYIDTAGLAPYSVRASGSRNKGKFDLYVSPQWIDALEYGAGYIPLFTPINFFDQQTIGGRRLIGNDLSTVAGSITDLASTI